jgi:hypothetical protein
MVLVEKFKQLCAETQAMFADNPITAKTKELSGNTQLLGYLCLILSREAQLFVGWFRNVGFHASTQPTFILYLIPPTHL